MRTLIKIVFIIFIANEIVCLGSDNCCNFSKYENIIKEREITAESLVNNAWYNAKENLILKIFEKNNNDVFTSECNGDKISFKLDKNNNLKIRNQKEKEDPLKLKDKKYALFGIETQEGENTVYLYCSDVESSENVNGIFEGTTHVSISVIACDTKNEYSLCVVI